MYNDQPNHEQRRLNRRDFLKKSSLVTLASMASAPAQAAQAERPPRPTNDDAVQCALIGFGAWGREIASTMARVPGLNLAAVVDTYDVMLQRAERSVPEAARHSDYRVVLDDPEVQAVLIATPTYTHRQIALDALEAGKHVYCEAPMASSIEDARALALAAREAEDQIFQVGLLNRSNPQYRSIFQVIRSGALGKPVMTRAQWHAKQSWRRASPNREREEAQNWRLDPNLSLGLVGEVGIHQLDTASWFLDALPVAVTGFGRVMLWDDGREMPDTVQAILEYPSGAHMMYDATLASSFDGMYDLFYGSNSTIMIRDTKAWMFKEVDAPMLGWEVYARKDDFYKEQGIALAANATQLDAQEQDPTADDPNVETPLFYALNEFADNHAYGPFQPAAGYVEGYRGVVVVQKAHEAVMQNEKVTIDASLFELG